MIDIKLHYSLQLTEWLTILNTELICVCGGGGILVYMLFVYIFVCAGVHVYVHNYICRPEIDVVYLPLLLSILNLETKIHFEPRAHQLGMIRQPLISKDLPVFVTLPC